MWSSLNRCGIVGGVNAALAERPAPGVGPRAGTARGAVLIRSAVALAALVALGLLAWFVLRTGTGQRLDDGAMSTVVAGRDTRLTVLSLLGRVSIGAIVVVAIACVVLALVQGRLAAAAFPQPKKHVKPKYGTEKDPLLLTITAACLISILLFTL